MDETLFARTGERKTRRWCTSVVALNGPAQLLDVVEGRTAKAASDWIEARPEAWRAGTAWATLHLCSINEGRVRCVGPFLVTPH